MLFILKRSTPEESPPSFPVILASVKGFMNRFNAGETLSEARKRKPRLAGGNEPGWGYILRGGLRKFNLALVRHHAFLGG
jgi:hypothetical protein